LEGKRLVLVFFGRGYLIVVFFGIWEGVFGFIWFLGFVKYAIKVWNGAKISIRISFTLYYCAKR
jgi:hypothetical protein